MIDRLSLLGTLYNPKLLTLDRLQDCCFDGSQVCSQGFALPPVNRRPFSTLRNASATLRVLYGATAFNVPSFRVPFLCLSLFCLLLALSAIGVQYRHKLRILRSVASRIRYAERKMHHACSVSHRHLKPQGLRQLMIFPFLCISLLFDPSQLVLSLKGPISTS